jgi:hypothetical protein
MAAAHTLESVLRLVDRRGDSECWTWLGTASVHGYGQVRFEGVIWRAHRLVWTLLVGPIFGDMTLDHLCRNKLCVNPNPGHLELATHSENVRRGNLARPRRDTCKQGHPFSPENTMHDGKQRRCLICKRAAGLRTYHATRNGATV